MVWSSILSTVAADLGELGLDPLLLVVGDDAGADGEVGGVGRLDDGLREAGVGHGRTRLVDADRLAHGVVQLAATGELDAEVEALGDDADDRRSAARHRRCRATSPAASSGRARPCRGPERTLPTLPRPLTAGCSATGLLATERSLQHPGDDQRGDHRGDDTDGQRDAEALDRTGAEEEEQSGREQGGDVGVDDRAPRLVEADREGPPQTRGRIGGVLLPGSSRRRGRWHRSPCRSRARSRRGRAGSAWSRGRRASRRRAARRTPARRSPRTRRGGRRRR